MRAHTISAVVLISWFAAVGCEGTGSVNYPNGEIVADGQSNDGATQELAKGGRYKPPADVAAVGQRQAGTFDYVYPPKWRGGGQCSGNFLPGSSRLGTFVRENFRGVSSIEGYACRHIRGVSSRMSVHGTGRAIDIMIPTVGGAADNGAGDAIANYLIEHATELGVQFVIWDRSKWNIEYGEVRHYHGSHPHHDHLHVELIPSKARNLRSFPSPSSSGSQPATSPPRGERYAVDLDVEFKGAKNPFDTGSSGAIADLYPGETQKTEIVLTNNSTERLENVALGYWLQRPFVSAKNYRIYDDHPEHDKQSWDRNSSDSESDNPPRLKMGQKGALKIHGFAPGESKKVVLDLVGETYSVGRVDHADIRVWIQHIDNVYGEQNGFFEEPTNGNKFDRIVHDYAEVDVLSRDHWAFRGSEEGDTEGWEARGTIDEFKLNAGYDALATHVVGNTSRIVSPEGIRFDADRFDELVLSSRAHGGRHQKAVYWARPGENFSESRVVRFESRGDSGWHRRAVDLSGHPKWSGTVTKLRIDILDGQAPGAGDSGWYDVRNIYFQSPDRRVTTRPGAALVD